MRRRLTTLKPLGWLLLGLVLIDLGVLATRPVWERHSPDDYAERLTGARAGPRDMLFVGGSPVSEGFDPERFTGLAWEGTPISSPYSVGLPGGTATDFAFALDAAATPGAPPRVVVYGAAITEWNDRRNEPHGAYSLWTWDDYFAVMARRPEARDWATRKFLEGRLRLTWAAFRHRHGIRLAAAHWAETQWPGLGGEAADEARKARAYSDALSAGTGYAPADFYADTDYAESKRLGIPPAPFDFLNRFTVGSHFQFVLEMQSWCRHHGATFVVVEMPVTHDFETRYAAELAASEPLWARLRGDPEVLFIPASREAVGLTDHDFADVIHLNRTGARKLSDFVRSRLGERSP